MILRKPYALFIKYFRLIHIILTFLIGYLIYRTNVVLTFFNDYITNPTINSGVDFSGQNFNIYMFIVPFLIIVFSIIILSLMFYKKKPVLFYITNIAIYTFVVIIYYIALTNVQILEIRILDVRVIRAIRDLLTASFLIQTLSITIMFIRATGFDIKKFNFGEDLNKIQVGESDREEFEVELSLDSDNLIRKYKRNLRHAKYVYIENRYLINTIVLIALLSLGFGQLLNTYVLNKTYHQGESFNTSVLTMKVNDSYLTKNNYKNKLIDENKTFVVVELELTNNSPNPTTLDILQNSLIIDGKEYKPTLNNGSNMLDLGVVYNNEKLDLGSHTYIFIYEIPNKMATKTMTYRYNDKTTYDDADPKYIKVALEPINLDTNPKTNVFKLGDEINFKDSVLDDSKLKIIDYNLFYSYIILYNYCASQKNCYESREYIQPSIVNTFDKGLLLVDGTITMAKDISAITNLYHFINAFGTFKYTINGQIKYQTIPFALVTSKKKPEANIYYIEIVKAATTAQSISIIFTIRNITYEYLLF